MPNPNAASSSTRKPPGAIVVPSGRTYPWVSSLSLNTHPDTSAASSPVLYSSIQSPGAPPLDSTSLTLIGSTHAPVAVHVMSTPHAAPAGAGSVKHSPVPASHSPVWIAQSPSGSPAVQLGGPKVQSSPLHSPSSVHGSPSSHASPGSPPVHTPSQTRGWHSQSRPGPEPTSAPLAPGD